jgi:hypothetical protein
MEEQLDEKKRVAMLGAKGFNTLNNQTYINIERLMAERSAYANQYTITSDEYFYNALLRCNEDLKNLLGIG